MQTISRSCSHMVLYEPVSKVCLGMQEVMNLKSSMALLQAAGSNVVE